MSPKKIITGGILAAGILLIPFSCHLTKKNTLDCSSVPSTYSADIKPIIEQNCYKCHGVNSKKGDFTTYDGLKKVVTSGDFEKHVLKDQDMPPSGPLPDDARKKIRCWLNNGAQNN